MEKFGLCFVKTNDCILGLGDDIKFSRFMIFNKRFELINSILYTVIDCISKNCRGVKKDRLVDDFIDQIEKGGFVYAHWDGTSETEDLIKQKTKATIRCIPPDSADEQGYCLFSGKKSDRRVIFAKAY